jgi:hypothetical protein
MSIEKNTAYVSVVGLNTLDGLSKIIHNDLILA